MSNKIVYLNLLSEEDIGVRKKVNYQCKAFKNLDYKVVQMSRKDYTTFLYKLESKSNGIIKKFLKIFSSVLLLKKTDNKKYFQKEDVLYIRYFMSSPILINYLKKLKEIGVKIIIEIPTYPYDQEIKKETLRSKWDKKYRFELYKYVDKIVTYSNDKEIWGIPCINISNGIDLDEVKIVNKKRKDINKIIFTSVSNCSFWHGIDRFLNSLLEYKKNGGEKEIIFNIVGEGTETSKLKSIVEDNPILKESVIFHGFKSGMGLDEIYNNTDIAVGSLGIHRIIGLKEVQPLKNREYCAKGIPFIISFKDPDFIDKEFVYNNISNDDRLFDICKIIEWYKNLKITSKEMREYSKQFSWDIQIKKVIDNIGD
ncbi:MAG: glycosyltransferase [Fusobacterium perfoetens]|uniref:glycosyltransferase n=1 Tax=Fusobacterium perfoetens TaxID=852 RepID=UPI0023EFEF3F|nr:glycosyltransferase [Fusobacterium perfoetens]MCI6152853.1 glycosyltransferase [Fusobacterium perfoetens]MDY3237263.1 glycosyltransferase [Fusobacterium perfoetens]